MSEKLMMEQSTYSRYENDKSTPGMDVINRVVSEFNVSLEWLMNSESKTVIFENGSVNHSLVQTDNYYAVPKEIIDALLKQQENISALLQQLLEKKG